MYDCMAGEVGSRAVGLSVAWLYFLADRNRGIGTRLEILVSIVIDFLAMAGGREGEDGGKGMERG